MDVSEIEAAVRYKAAAIAEKKGYSHDYRLKVEDFGAGNEVDIAISCGTPATIHVSIGFVVLCTSTKKLHRLRDRLERALEKVPVMSWTLSNPSPVTAIVLCKDQQRWLSTDNNSFKVTEELVHFYSVTVLDEISGNKITKTTDNPLDLIKLTEKAYSQLKNLLHPIISDEEKYSRVEMYTNEDESIITRYQP